MHVYKWFHFDILDMFNLLITNNFFASYKIFPLLE